MNLGVDLTAAWRRRVGMVTLSLNLAREMLADAETSLTIFASRTRPTGWESADARFLLSPHRHEVVNKLAWLPFAEVGAGLDAVLYPFWPPPPRRRRGAPPAVFFVHDLAFRLRPAEVPWQQRAYLGTILPSALEHAAAVVCPSLTTRQDLLQEYPVPGLAERTHVVPEGPTLPDGGAGELPAGLQPGFILAVGTVEKRKNYTRLVAAYRLLSNPPPLVIAGGPGWQNDSEMRLLRSTPGVVYLGWVGDALLARLYREASLFAFPSLYEGFGLPLLDAFLAGTPALISSAGALPELAAGAALEVDPEDVESIRSGLQQMLDDEPLRRRLAAAGKARGPQYGWASAAGSVLGILNSAAG